MAATRKTRTPKRTTRAPRPKSKAKTNPTTPPAKPVRLTRQMKRRLLRKVLGMSDQRLLSVSRSIFANSTVFANQIVSTAVTTLVESHRRIYPQHAEGIANGAKEAINSLLESDSSCYGDNPNWTTIIGKDIKLLCGGPQSLEIWRNEARLMHIFNPLYRGLVEVFVDFVVGEELQVSFTHDEKTVVTKSEKQLKKWRGREGSDFEERLEEIVRRAVRDGECFVWEREGPIQPPGDVVVADKGPKFALLRFLEPQQIQEPEKNNIVKFGGLTAEEIAARSFTHGVETDAADPETIYAYWIKDDDKNSWTRIPQDQIRHIKINCDRNAKRGVPLLLTVTSTIRNYDKWLTARLILNQLRSAIAMIIYREESIPGDIENAIDEESDVMETSVNPDGEEVEIPTRLINMGSVMNLDKGMKAEFPSLQTNAQDASADGEAILRQIAVSLGLPDYMVTGDASSSSYSSQQVAEARGAKTLLKWQLRFYKPIGLICKDIIEIEGDLSKAELNDLTVVITGPKVVYRDQLEQAQEIEILVGNGVQSKKTSRAKLGLNNEEEENNIAEERTEDLGAGEDTGIPRDRAQNGGRRRREAGAANQPAKGGRGEAA